MESARAAVAMSTGTGRVPPHCRVPHRRRAGDQALRLPAHAAAVDGGTGSSSAAMRPMRERRDTGLGQPHDDRPAAPRVCPPA